MNQIKKTIEGLKESQTDWKDIKASWQYAIDNGGASEDEFKFDKADRIIRACSHAIQIAEAQSQASDKIPEKKDVYGTKNEGLSYEEQRYREGFNQCHDLLSPLFGKMKGRINLLEEKIKKLEIDNPPKI